MIYIMGSETQSNLVANQACIPYNEWVWLHWGMQLMGVHKPDVVVLNSARHIEGFHDILDMAYDRSGTAWSEMDLINGRVPR